jgi:hypothetical protein
MTSLLCRREAIRRNSAAILPARRSWLIVTRTLRAYLDRQLRGPGGDSKS